MLHAPHHGFNKVPCAFVGLGVSAARYRAADTPKKVFPPFGARFSRWKGARGMVCGLREQGFRLCENPEPCAYSSGLLFTFQVSYYSRSGARYRKIERAPA